jgi:hypothetical protein
MADEEQTETLDDEEGAGDPAGDDELDPEIEEQATEETEEAAAEEEEAEKKAASAPTVEPVPSVEQARAKLTQEQRDRLEAQRKRAADLGYSKSFEDAEREELPGIAAKAQRQADKQAEKAAKRKALLREYPSMRTAADGPEDGAA